MSAIITLSNLDTQQCIYRSELPLAVCQKVVNQVVSNGHVDAHSIRLLKSSVLEDFVSFYFQDWSGFFLLCAILERVLA